MKEKEGKLIKEPTFKTGSRGQDEAPVRETLTMNDQGFTQSMPTFSQNDQAVDRTTKPLRSKPFRGTVN